MPFTSHEPHESGGILFRDGSDPSNTLLATGPSAVQAAQQIDQNNGLTNAPMPGSQAYLAQLRTDQNAGQLADNGSGVSSQAPEMASTMTPGMKDAWAGSDKAEATERQARDAQISARAADPLAGLPAVAEDRSPPVAGGAPSGGMSLAPPSGWKPPPAPPPPGGIRFAAGAGAAPGGGASAAPDDAGARYQSWLDIATKHELAKRGGGVIKGKDVPTGYTLQTQAGPDPKLVKAREDAQHQVGLYESDIASAQAHGQQDTEDAQGAAATEHAAYQAKLERLGAAREKGLGDIFGQIQAKQQQVAAGQIDPEAWWGSRSDGQRVAATIAMALGGALAGAQGGRNMGADAINEAVSRNIDGQKANLANQRGALTDLQQIYQTAREKFGDDKLATDAMHMAALDNVKQRMSAIVQQTATRESEIRAHEVMPQLDLKIAELREQLSTAARGQKAEQHLITQDHAAGGGANFDKVLGYQKQAFDAHNEGRKLDIEASKANGDTKPPGTFVVGNDAVTFAPGLPEGDQSELRKRAAASNGAIATLARMKANGATSNWWGGAAAKAEASQLAHQLAEAHGQAKVSPEAEAAVQNNLLGSGYKAADEYQKILEDQQKEIRVQAQARPRAR